METSLEGYVAYSIEISYRMCSEHSSRSSFYKNVPSLKLGNFNKNISMQGKLISCCYLKESKSGKQFNHLIAQSNISAAQNESTSLARFTWHFNLNTWEIELIYNSRLLYITLALRFSMIDNGWFHKMKFNVSQRKKFLMYYTFFIKKCNDFFFKN